MDREREIIDAQRALTACEDLVLMKLTNDPAYEQESRKLQRFLERMIDRAMQAETDRVIQTMFFTRP